MKMIKNYENIVKQSKSHVQKRSQFSMLHKYTIQDYMFH